MPPPRPMVPPRRRPGLPCSAPPPLLRRFRFRLPLPASGRGRGSFRRDGAGRMAGAGRPVPTCLLLGAAGGGKSLLARRLRHIRRGGGGPGGGGSRGPGGAGSPGARGGSQSGRVPGAVESLTVGTAERRGGSRGAGRPPGHAAHGRQGPAGAARRAAGPVRAGGAGAAVPAPPPSRQVGTNLTDLRLPRKATVRELGGCMGPIWPSYYGECSALMVSHRHAGPHDGGDPVSSRGPEGGARPGDTGLGAGPCPAVGRRAPRFPRFPWPGCARGQPGAAPHAAFLLQQFVVDAANPSQVSNSCVQLLSVLSAAQLASVPVLVLFNKM